MKHLKNLFIQKHTYWASHGMAMCLRGRRLPSFVSRASLFLRKWLLTSWTAFSIDPFPDESPTGDCSGTVGAARLLATKLIMSKLYQYLSKFNLSFSRFDPSFSKLGLRLSKRGRYVGASHLFQQIRSPLEIGDRIF